MNGNFDRVNLQGDDKIKVEGWLSWDPGDQKADLSIAVTQGTVTASKPKTVTVGETTWDVVIDVAKDSFSKGTASGQAGAIVTTQAGSASQSWQSAPIQVK